MSATSIVVVNWNTRELTLECLRSVKRRTRVSHEIVLVDNGSEDGSLEAFQELAWPELRIVSLPRNLGFAGGSNAGIEAAVNERICLLNSDCLVTDRWLTHMLQVMDHHGAGLVGPCTNRCKGRQRRKPWFGRIPPFPRPTRQVEFLSFFCVMLSRATLAAVGRLDTRFGPGTFEDDDYCRRAREAGLSLWMAGRAWVWHEAHATFAANRLDDRTLQEKNREVYDSKWGEGGTP